MVLIKKKKNNLYESLDSLNQDLVILTVEESQAPFQPNEKKVVEKEPVVKQTIIPRVVPKSFSIKEALKDNGNQQIKKEIEDSQIIDEEESLELDLIDTHEEFGVFNQFDLESTWQQFIQGHLSGKPRYASLLSNYTPKLEQKFIVTVDVESHLQIEMFNEIKVDLLFFLRKKLDNKKITLEVNLQSQENIKSPMYTIEDRFKYLSQLNPNLLELKQQLKLDFE